MIGYIALSRNALHSVQTLQVGRTRVCESAWDVPGSNRFTAAATSQQEVRNAITAPGLRGPEVTERSVDPEDIPARLRHCRRELSSHHRHRKAPYIRHAQQPDRRPAWAAGAYQWLDTEGSASNREESQRCELHDTQLRRCGGIGPRRAVVVSGGAGQRLDGRVALQLRQQRRQAGAVGRRHVSGRRCGVLGAR